MEDVIHVLNVTADKMLIVSVVKVSLCEQVYLSMYAQTLTPLVHLTPFNIDRPRISRVC